MSFTPVLPIGGYAGWKFLNRTLDAQKEAFTSAPAIQRDEAYFREKIGSVTTAQQLVDDRRLLSVALGAFGLDDDINNKFFVRKILEDGTLEPSALANKLSDKRYLELSKAFGFGDFDTPNTQLSDFADKIISSYETRQFEVAVGSQNDDMRLAMNAQRELGELADRSVSEDTKWFTVLGSAPLRTVFQTAFGLPSSFASVDLDKQLVEFKDRAQRILGSSDPGQFSDPEKTDDLVRLYLLRSEANAFNASTTSGATALTLLQNAGSFRYF